MAGRIALGLEYNGSAYCGWQSQTNAPSVQDALEHALSQIAQRPVNVVAAGRTDTGVHAALQVVHFDPPVDRPMTAWSRGVNTHLPADVSVRWAKPVSNEFHARFAASRRAYEYHLANRPTRPGLSVGRIGWHFKPLALAPMNAAALLLLGEHDFSAFRAAECQAKSPFKTLHRAEISQSGSNFLFRFEADAYLHHMIRNIVGSLMYVGDGRWSVDQFAAVLASGDRSRAAPTFMPDGLYLCGIWYDARYDLPEHYVSPSL